MDLLPWSGHSGVQGNERADTLTGTAAVDNNITLDTPTVIVHVKEHFCSNREQIFKDLLNSFIPCADLTWGLASPAAAARAAFMTWIKLLIGLNLS